MEITGDLSHRIEEEMRTVLGGFDQRPFSAIPQSYRETITSYLSRKGKFLRPALFVMSYASFAQKPARNIYRSAVGIELLHDFALIHDDIIDRSLVRRNGPAMHAALKEKLAEHGGRKFSGENMAMVVGDMIYALGIRLFMSVDEPAEKKHAALECLTQAALYTACGELKELLDTLEPLERITSEAITQTCEWKTAYYTFGCPVLSGALLGGVADADREALLRYSLSIGLAYQIMDDAVELTDARAAQRREGDLSDLREGKRTLPVWFAFNNCTRRDRARLSDILNGGKPSRRDMETAREIIVRAGGLNYARSEIDRCLREGRASLDAVKMDNACRESLWRRTVSTLDKWYEEAQETSGAGRAGDRPKGA